MSQAIVETCPECHGTNGHKSPFCSLLDLSSALAENDCNADLGHPCDANDGEPCHECAANEAYWRREWERYGKHEPTREEFEADVHDAYSDPTERAKRNSLLRENQ